MIETSMEHHEKLLKPYSDYYNTGIDWIGKIPANWKIIPIKAICIKREENNRPDLPLLSVYRDYGVLLFNSRDDNNNRPSLDLTTYKVVKHNDLVLNKMKTWQGSLAVSELDGIVSPAYIVCKLTDLVYPRYIHHLLRSKQYINQYMRLSYGVRVDQWDMRFDDFKLIYAIIPPYIEQQKIAQFIDENLVIFDSIIAKKQRLIELLHEKRTALISHAVTKGLDLSVPIKDSGVEWIGKIPTEWTLKKIKHLLINLIDTEHKTVPFYIDSEYLVVRTSNIRNGKLILNDAKYTDYSGYCEWTQRGKPEPGDIIFTREAPAGEACVVPSDVKLCLGQRTVLIKVNRDLINGEFLVYSIYSRLTSQYINLISQGSTVTHFNMSDISNIPIITPPIEEQVKIVEYLNKNLSDIDLLISKVQQGIELLKEYRTSLISTAVTGKIDVRGEAP